jgi:hypothetical protein
MVELFKRGCALQAAGHDDDEDGSPGHDEFKAVDKRLSWALLKLPTYAVSVFDLELDGEMPGYMERLAASKEWPLCVALRRALLQASDLSLVPFPSKS